MKKLNKFIAFVATAVLCFAMFAFAGCNKAEAYTFTVKYEDGTAAENVTVQLCKGTDFCDSKMATTDAEGKAELVPTNGADEYDIHIWAAGMKKEYEVTKTEKTPAEYGDVEVTIKK